MTVFKADVKIYQIHDVDKLKDMAGNHNYRSGDANKRGASLDDISGQYLAFTVAGSSIEDLSRRVSGIIALSAPVEGA